MTLLPGEEVRARFLANRLQGDRGYCGHVLVTSRRVEFEPVALSQARGGDRWEIPLEQVAAADVAPRGWNRALAHGGTGYVSGPPPGTPSTSSSGVPARQPAWWNEPGRPTAAGS
jgi:hypothetical protein